VDNHWAGEFTEHFCLLCSEGSTGSEFSLERPGEAATEADHGDAATVAFLLAVLSGSDFVASFLQSDVSGNSSSKGATLDNHTVGDV